MSGDEIIATIGSFFVGIFAWIPGWYRYAFRRRFAHDTRASSIVLFAPLFCALLLLAVLLTLAADDVRRDPVYLFFYTLMGMAWIGGWAAFFGAFGIRLREDVAEGKNRAAAIALAGSLIAVTLAFAGGNIGNGPGWWVVVVCAALSTGAIFVLWMLIEWTTGVSERVTVERDVAAAIRFAGLVIALGVILGRAVAGDWESLDATLEDFWRVGWPALLLAAAGIIVERGLRFVPVRTSSLAFGVLPLLAYLSAAIWYVAMTLPPP
ncbi:MAG: hypothetical protein AABO58_05305 [Acidobacteriota bacterium]